MPLPKPPQTSTLDHLPLEILLQILQNLTIPSLYTLLRIYRRSRTTFSTYHTQIITHILSTTLPNPNFLIYFPYAHNTIPYPLSSTKPLETSHIEAYTYLRYARSLLSLSETVSTLTTHIYSITSSKVLKEITPRYTILLNHSAQFPYEDAITSTIYRTIISNAQTLFYTSNLNPLHSFSKSNPFIPPPRPPLLEYPESIARRLLPEEILPQETPSDEIILQLSNTDNLETPLIKQTHRYLRRLIVRTLTIYLKRHKIFNEVCIIPSWEQIHDSVLIRDGLFFYLGVHPELLLKVLIQCNTEDEGNAIRRTNGDQQENLGKKERKLHAAIAVELGKVYANVCETTHKILEEIKRNGGKPTLTDVEEVANTDYGGVLATVPLLSPIGASGLKQ
ncbi:uncharacterized protein DFL_006475 [Arthrobotrys flagrans]|uniref:F-box domain-containing protein n=1 Tax=Arthrobotrys flagrans TaxID=97331 RepID=A0A437A0W5_ARTFL|nr:hypothetical protein DFL_006475 [Arthrobotrys flagrans]